MKVNPSIESALAEMRAMAAQAASSAPQSATENQPQGTQFAQMLSGALNQVNELQSTSSGLQKAFSMGDPNVGLAEVMIASQKSSLSFQALTQVRNKLLESYQEIMRMGV